MKAQQQRKASLFRRRFINTVCFSWHGLRDAWATEEAFRIEVLVSILLVPAAVLLGRTNVEVALLICSLFLVLIVELVNTAIEKTVDRISTTPHALSKSIKDIGSAAVLLSIILTVILWGTVIIDRVS